MADRGSCCATPPWTPRSGSSTCRRAGRCAGLAGVAAYCASKAALRMIGMVAAVELDEPPAGVPSRDAADPQLQAGTVDTAMQANSRAQRLGDFPWVGVFHEFEARGMVVTPDRPAAEIVEFLESNSGPRDSAEAAAAAARHRG